MSSSANGGAQPCADCGAPAGRECIHSLMNGMDGAGIFTQVDSPLTTPTDHSAATSAASWQRSTSTPPRTLVYLLPPTPHLPHLNSFSLPSREHPAEETPIQDPVSASQTSQAVVSGPGPTHQYHSPQVTASDQPTSRFNHSPVAGEFGGPQLGVVYHPTEDSKPYISQAFPQDLQRPSSLTNTSHPRSYHPTYPYHTPIDYQYAHNTAMDSQYQGTGQGADSTYQISHAGVSSYGSLRFANLPTTDDLSKATVKAFEIYTKMRMEGKGTADPVRQAATREIPSLDHIPKSANLNRLQGIQTYFPDGLTAEAYRAACRPSRYKKVDKTLPETADAKRAHVRTLVTAFNSVEYANDNQTMKQPFIEKRHDQRLVECLCWEILRATISRAEFEEPLMQSYDVTKARPSHGITTFGQRFDAVVESMVHCKTICKHMYDAPYLNIVVDDPTKAKARVDANRALNAVKAKQMAEGKKAQELKQEEKGSPTPAPKRRRTTRATPTPATQIENPFRPLPPSTDTPPRSMPSLAKYDTVDQTSSDPPHYSSSPHDMDVSPARLGTVSKVEYSEPIYGQGPRFLTSQYGMGMGVGAGMGPSMGRDSHGNIIPIFQPPGMAMGPAPPGIPAPMQPEAFWNRSQFSTMNAPNVDFSLHGGRQQASYNHDGSQFAGAESSDFDAPGSGYGSAAENDSSPT